MLGLEDQMDIDMNKLLAHAEKLRSQAKEGEQLEEGEHVQEQEQMEEGETKPADRSPSPDVVDHTPGPLPLLKDSYLSNADLLSSMGQSLQGWSSK